MGNPNRPRFDAASSDEGEKALYSGRLGLRLAVRCEWRAFRIDSRLGRLPRRADSLLSTTTYGWSP